MKKIISLVLAIALMATLAVSASAVSGVVVVHNQCDPWCTQNQVQHGEHTGLIGNLWGDHQCSLTADNGWSVRVSSWNTKLSNKPADLELTWTKCAEALTIKEMKAIVADAADINNLTVFYQRNFSTVTGGTMDVRLWTVARKNQSVVVLIDEGEGWKVLAQGNPTEKDVQVTLNAESAGRIAVCLAW